MPLPADYHMHTPLCRHAVGEPTEYAARAVALGLKEIGFTDHSPMRRDDFDNWRMRSEIVLESKDQAAVSELLGQLQQMRLAIGNLSQQPSPATRRAAEDEATREAIRAFQGRAKLVADTFGKPYRIKQLNIQQAGRQPPIPMFKASRAMAAEAAPLPLEAGESLVTTTVSGQIELAD